MKQSSPIPLNQDQKTLNNIEGIIVGKAIYDGDIKLDDLVKEDA